MTGSNALARIGLAERQARLSALRGLMGDAGLAAVVIGATASLRYFTGMSWGASERFTGAVVHAAGGVEYVCPGFEREKVAGIVGVPGEIFTWEEEENPYALIASRLKPGARMGLDDKVALFVYLGLCRALSRERIADAGPLIHRLRRRKSAAEIALMSRAKAITLEVQRRAWQSLEPGVRASEVVRFIDNQHRALGADSGNTFCIVSFAEDTSLPHGGEQDRALMRGDVVLIDTGCHIDGYNSDITRTYVFGEAPKRVRDIWQLEKAAQAAAFAAARLGTPCESVDAAARAVLAQAGLGPDYRLPGLPHRTGHGIGLDIHEAPNLVRGDATPLEPGMCFSNEPMIVMPGAFGVRLEDHFYMTEAGPRWFTEPSASIDDPFANAPAFDG
ncbi:MAG TPA: Xaa-Pro peptidase family protein [Rhizomicrobium sp.]|nr:Xaa-Pro peptidase family protein [Rhizomicrobium sp.]